MPFDDDDDLFNEEFDLVDDDDYDDDEEDAGEEEATDDASEDGDASKDDAPKKEVEAEKPERKPARKKRPSRGRRSKAAASNGVADSPAEKAAVDGGAEAEASGEADKKKTGEGEPSDGLDEFGRPKPEANYVVHVYEHKAFKRTIDRPFTPEDAEAFTTEFNRTGKSYGRLAIAGKNDAKPKKSAD